MRERTERLVDHLEAGLESSERAERRYHLRHALQYARALEDPPPSTRSAPKDRR